MNGEHWIWVSNPPFELTRELAGAAETPTHQLIPLQEAGQFETTLDKGGKIKTAAIVGGGNMMDVIGQISNSGSKIKLKGYCKFEGPLSKKQ